MQMDTNSVLFVSFVSALQVFGRYVVILRQPLHHERLKPPAIASQFICIRQMEIQCTANTSFYRER